MTDTFSSTMGGQPWYAWEWLYDAAAAGFHQAGGLQGVIFLTALLLALTFAALYRVALGCGSGAVVGLALSLLGMAASMVHFLARPHVVSWALGLFWIWSLEASAHAPDLTRRKGKLFLLPIIMLLWVNVHGGFVLGLLLIGIYLVADLGRRFWRCAGEEGEPSRAGPLALALAGCVAATFCNPYGYKLHRHIAGYLFNRFLMDHIQEFQSPDFHSASQKCFLVLLLLAIATLATSRFHLSLRHLLLVFFAVSSALYATRNLPFSSMLLVIVLAPALSRAVRQAAIGKNRGAGFAGRVQGFSERMERIERGLRGHLWPIMAVLILGWACLHQGRIGKWQALRPAFSESNLPLRATDMLIRQGIRGPVFCPDSWGGYVIYRLYPAVKVVVDDRHDLYGEEFLRRYLTVLRAEPGWDGYLGQWNPEVLLLPASSSLAAAAGRDEAWKNIYQDSVAAVFVRAEPGG